MYRRYCGIGRSTELQETIKNVEECERRGCWMFTLARSKSYCLRNGDETRVSSNDEKLMRLYIIKYVGIFSGRVEADILKTIMKTALCSVVSVKGMTMSQEEFRGLLSDVVEPTLIDTGETGLCN